MKVKRRMGLLPLVVSVFLIGSYPIDVVGQDSTKTEVSKLKPYHEVLKGDVQTMQGMFDVHKVNDKYYFEIPQDFLNKDMLLVTRFSKTPRGMKHGGEQISEHVFQWERMDNKIFIRLRSFHNVITKDSSLYDAFLNSNVHPIYADFSILAENEEKNSVVIDVTSFAKGDELGFGLSDVTKKIYQLSSIETNKSYINEILTYPTNISITSTKTYKAAKNQYATEGGGRLTFEINNSLVLLPEDLMTPRLEDRRIGYFAQQQTDYGLNKQGVEETSYIRRWRLEPKDQEAYLAGKLTDPVKPIVFYIDPATPPKWIPYLKQGVEDWLGAFEDAGFKNAIMAKEAPTVEEDSTWSVIDTRNSVIRYLASVTENANGPHVADPRTGEILSSHIGWYHNVMNLIRNWYFVQTAASNPEARLRTLDDEVMGKLIRYIAAHEVGHALGLPHNFIASASYPVDSLRSQTFTDAHGSTASIMDYARFNYIAQPDDGVRNYMPQIGPYDKYSIEWGYRYYPDIEHPKDELPYLNRMIEEKSNDPIYRYSKQLGMFERQNDSRAQTEDLGDNAVKASVYGIKNLQVILDNLYEWTYKEGDNYDALADRYERVFSQWQLFINHVHRNIGGIYEDHKSMDQPGPVYAPVPAEFQREAISFIQEYVFKTPKWLIDPSIADLLYSTGQIDKLRRTQDRILTAMLNVGNFDRLEEWVTRRDGSFTVPEMLRLISEGLFDRSVDLDGPRKILQRNYIDYLQAHLISNLENSTYDDDRNRLGMRKFVKYNGYSIYAESALSELKSQIKKARRGTKRADKAHYNDLLKRIG